MPFSLEFPCHPNFKVHSSVPFSQPRTPFFCSIRNNNETHEGKYLFLTSTPHKTPSVLSSESQIDLAEQSPDTAAPENFKLCLEKSHSRSLPLEDLVATIAALSTSERVEFVDYCERNGRFLSTSDFNDMLMALVMADEFELALKLNSSLSSYRLSPDSWTYSILVICYCKKNEPFEAKSVLDHMLENGFQPSVATFTTLINSFCRRGRLQKAFEVFEIMGSIGCKPTINTYNCLLKGLCYVGRVEEACELLVTIKKSPKKPDIYSYTAVMDGLCKVGRSNEAMELLDEIGELGLTPSVVTYNTLFNGYFKEGRPLDGLVLLNRMKERNCMPDYISYSTLLHGLLKWGEVRTALKIYKEMKRIGLKVDERMTNTLLRGLCRRSRKEKGLLKEAYEVFESMRNGDCSIYPCAYDLVVEAFCNGKDTRNAFLSLQEMAKLGYFPRTSTFDNVIRELCLEGKIYEALSVLVLMQTDQRIPSAISFNSLIRELNRKEMALGASCVYSAALKRGVLPWRKPGE